MTPEPVLRDDANRGQLIDELLRTPMSRRDALRRGGMAGLALTGMSTLLAACGGGSTASGSGAQQLVMSSGATPVTLDPMTSLDGQSPLLWRCVYETLLEFKGSSTDLEPHLAKAYEYDTKANRLVFHLRDGITFTDGAALDAAAVKLNVERQMAVNQGIAYALAPIKKIETPDASTVVLHTSGYSDGLLDGFASLYGLYLISPKAIQDHKGKDWAQSWLRSNMVGTGPYQLENYALNQQAAFTKHDKYWGGFSGPHFERVVVQYVNDASSERLQLERGTSSVAFFLPDDDVYAMRDEQGVDVLNRPAFTTYYIGLPCHTGPTADKRVRQAISYGFDYDTANKHILNGTATQPHGPLPHTFPGYDASLPRYEYDPDRARKMLADAGHEGGGFELKYIYESGYYWKRPFGELFQANMKDLGITVSTQELSPSTWAAKLQDKSSANEAYGVAWWPSLATPFDFLWTLFATSAQGSSGYNFTYYSNKTFDGLLDQATSEVDKAKRMALYQRCQQIVVDDAPYLYISDVNYLLPMASSLKGAVFNPMYLNVLDPYELHT
ncbi:MAG TPA: ABC transporter substrate-binding protein [Baekduia sp.]|nr:ABC transporter substrate-binding protein [Baekduia sp.]